MKRPKVLGPALLAGGLFLAPEPAAGQAEIGAQVDLFSAYVWRGVSMTNKPVAQPSAYLSFPAGRASVTVGGWGNIDIGKYDDLDDDFSQSGGAGSFNFAEFDPYAEVSVPAGKATLTGGVIGYIFPNDFGFTDDFNTWEVYGKVGFDAPLAPELAVYYDVDKVNGAYIQGSIGHALALNQSLSLELGAAAGFSAGQGIDEDGEDNANYEDDGFSYFDLSAGLPFAAGLLAITPVVHFQVSGDRFAKLTSPTDDSDVKLWGGVSVGWARALGAAVPE